MNCGSFKLERNNRFPWELVIRFQLKVNWKDSWRKARRFQKYKKSFEWERKRRQSHIKARLEVLFSCWVMVKRWKGKIVRQWGFLSQDQYGRRWFVFHWGYLFALDAQWLWATSGNRRQWMYLPDLDFDLSLIAKGFRYWCSRLICDLAFKENNLNWSSEDGLTVYQKWT